MFLRNFDNVCAVCNGVNSNFGGKVFGDASVYCKTLNGNLNTSSAASYGNPIGYSLSTNDYGSTGSESSSKKLALSFGSDTDEPTYEDYEYTSVTASGFIRTNTSRTTTYDAESDTYTVTLAMDFYNNTDNDVVANTFVLRGDLSSSSSYPFIFYKELLKDESDELAPITFPAKKYKHIEFKYTVKGHIYKPIGVSAP
jgi:hypothetical protein